MKSYKHILLIIGGIIIIAIVGFVAAKSSGESGPYDDFAKCITDSGAKMYGAYWCSHCKSQKEDFESSWQYIDYTECASAGGGQKQECADANITGYPTWEFGDGERVPGRLSFEELSNQTGCELPQTE